jgi:hypothetical protein
MGIHGTYGLSDDAILHELRFRADQDFLNPPVEHESGRHQVDLPDFGLRVSLTRSRYPNKPDGQDTYVVTISRLELDVPPEEGPTRRVLYALFGEGAEHCEERQAGESLVRIYRVPATRVPPQQPLPA